MLEAKNVVKTFDGFRALDSLNMTVPKGAVYGLVGPNGAGKSTIIRHLAGIYRQDSGEVLLDGQPVYENPQVKRRMTVIGDDWYYFPQANIREMARFFAGLYPAFSWERYEKLKQVFPLAKKYGGVVVGLALDEDGIPDTVEGRLAIAEKIYKTGESYGIARKDIVIDALTMTMSTDSNSANVTLETVRRIKAQGGRTVLGVSNISFGLPQREIITSAFFTMAMQAGLSAGIVNPNSQAMMQAYDTFRVLGGYDAQCMSYVEKYSAMKVVSTTVKACVANIPVSALFIAAIASVLAFISLDKPEVPPVPN